MTINFVKYLIKCIKFSVIMYNLFKGVFLVPYFLILIICGIPLLFMELAIGQFTRRGPIGALSQLCPIFKGNS